MEKYTSVSGVSWISQRRWKSILWSIGLSFDKLRMTML